MADITKDFAGLPIGQLICTPIIEVAKGQSELCKVYLDYLFKLAYVDGKVGGETRIISFNLQRQIVDEAGNSKMQNVKVDAPLLSLVPIPAFTMDEATVRFTMEVKDSVKNTQKDDFETSFQTGFSYWGFSANVSGKVTTSSENVRQSDTSAKYELYARACQQPPSEGMAKLTSLFASIIEPVKV